MRSSMELSGEGMSHLSLAHSMWASWVGWMGHICWWVWLHSSAVQLPVLMRRGGQVWQVQGCLLHTIWSGDALSTDGPWVSIQWQCLGLIIVKCLIHCMLSVWFHRGKVQLACHLKWYDWNNLAKMQSGIIYCRLPWWFGPISAGMVTVAQASVSASMLIAVVLTWTSSHWVS